MSKLSLINLNKIDQNKDINNEQKDLINKKIDFDNSFINTNLNLSFDNYFYHKDKYLDKEFIDDKNEDNIEIKNILNDLDKNIALNIKENENAKECEEILNILKKPLSDKNVRFNYSPFKPLLKPRKISMVGKVFYDIPNDDNNLENNNTQNSTNNSNEC